MSQAPSIAEAQLMLQLYDLRREAEMRKARNYVTFEFQPKTFDEFAAVASAFGTQENAHFRQVYSYWDMAASLVTRGVVQPDFFFEWNGELVFLYNKCRPFLEQMRNTIAPEFMKRAEEAIGSSEVAQRRLAVVQKRMAALKEQAQAAQQQK